MEEVQEADTPLEANDNLVLMQEFAAIYLNVTNDIDYVSYSLVSPTLSLSDKNPNPMVFAALQE